MDYNYCPYCMAFLGKDGVCPKCGKTSSDYQPAPNHLRPNTELSSRYVIGGVLGEGGFGITYVGYDLRLGTKVAIKEYYPTAWINGRISTVSPELSLPLGQPRQGFEKGKKRFLREAQILSQMEKQPNIVNVRDFFEANNTAYIIMEFVEGQTLKQITEQRGRIAPGELFKLIEPLFTALSNMHSKGLIHRDISPDNIMIENGVAHLLDFGCAREINQSETQAVIVKPGFAPIEQYTSNGTSMKQGTWTDVYALSATIYFCLTGIVPPYAPDRMIPPDPLIPPTKLDPKVLLTEAEEKALLAGLHPMPTEGGRLQTIQQLYDALYHPEPVSTPAPATPSFPDSEPFPVIDPDPVPVSDPDPVPPPVPVLDPDPDPAPKRRRWIPILIAVLAVAAVIIGCFAGGIVPWPLSPEPTPTPQPPATAIPTVVPTATPTAVPSPTPTPAPGQGEMIGLELFDDQARVLQTGSYDRGDLSTLMLDDQVKAVVLDAGATLDLNQGGNGEYTLRKPLLVREGATLRANWLRIPDSAALRVDGTLDCRGVITLEGNQTRMALSRTAALTKESKDCAVLLMDAGTALAAEDISLVRSLGYHVQIKPQRPSNIVSVKTLAQLIQYSDEAGASISIDADIDLGSNHIDMNGVSIWISKGVTLKGDPEVGSLGVFNYNNYINEPVPGMLYNEGNVECVLWVAEESVVYNQGAVHQFGMWDHGLFLNSGVIDMPANGNGYTDSYLVNMGQMNMAAYTIEYSPLTNLNEAVLTNHDSSDWMNVCTVRGGSVYNSGKLVYDGNINYPPSGWIVNDGGTIELHGTRFRVNIYNRSGSVLTDENLAQAVVIVGAGEVDSPRGYQLTSVPGMLPQKFAEASDDKSLQQALSAGRTVCFTGEADLKQNLNVTGTLYIAGNLTVPTITLNGGQVHLLAGGSLTAQRINLRNHAAVSMVHQSSLTVSQKLDMITAALFADGGDLHLDGAEVTLRDGACLVPMALEDFSVAGANILLSADSQMDIPGSTTTRRKLSSAKLTAEYGSVLRVAGDAEFNDCSLTFNSSTELLLVGKDIAVFRNCQLLSDHSTIYVQHVNIELLQGTKLENREGDMMFWTDQTHNLLVGRDCSVVNSGTITLGWTTVTAKAKTIKNTGHIYTSQEYYDVDVDGTPFEPIPMP